MKSEKVIEMIETELLNGTTAFFTSDECANGLQQVKNDLKMLYFYKKAFKELNNIFNFRIAYEYESDGEYVATMLFVENKINDWTYTTHNGGDAIRISLLEMKKNED